MPILRQDIAREGVNLIHSKSLPEHFKIYNSSLQEKTDNAHSHSPQRSCKD